MNTTKQFDCDIVDDMQKEINQLREQKNKLMEHIVYLKKNGYTYDQRNNKMILCDICGKQLTGEFVKTEDNTSFGGVR